MKMVKGVNKNIIEVHDVKSDYFERAILFVKPEYALFDNEKLFREARKYVNQAQLNRSGANPLKNDKRKGGKNLQLLPKLAYSTGAAALTAVICYFVYTV